MTEFDPHAAAKWLRQLIIDEAPRMHAEIERLRAELRIKSDFIRSRQCSDHNGKWERGGCLQCDLERAKAAYSSACVEMHGLLMELGLKNCGFGTPKDWHVKAKAEVDRLRADLAIAKREALEAKEDVRDLLTIKAVADWNWLMSHCHAIGMKDRANLPEGETRDCHHIALFTIDLKAERDALKADAEQLSGLLRECMSCGIMSAPDSSLELRIDAALAR